MPESRYFPFPVIYDHNVYLLFSSHVNNAAAAAVSSVDFPFCAYTAIIAAGTVRTRIRPRTHSDLPIFHDDPISLLPVTAKPVVKKKEKSDYVSLLFITA